MIRIPFVSESDERELLRMAREEPGRVALRAQVIVWAYQDQQTIPQLASRIGWTAKRVRRWVKRFLADGPIGLYDQPGRGRKAKLSGSITQQIAQELDNGQPPEHTGYVCWTLTLLAGWLKAHFDLQISLGSLRRYVHDLGFVWRRPKLESESQDPQRSSKLARIAEVLKETAQGAVVLYEDETTLRLLPVLRGMWMRLGQQYRVLVQSGWNQSVKCFGVLHAVTGELITQMADKCNSHTFLAFLEQIVATYPDQLVYLILDNASWHRAKLVQAWLETHPMVELVWLPFGSPKLNPIERIWGKLKDRIAANRWRGTLAVLRKAAEEFLASLTPEQTIQIAKLAA